MHSNRRAAHFFSWAAKDELFFPPLGWFLRAIGGIPVNRRARTDFVGQMVKHFETRDAFVLGIAPEGTRGTKTFWKTGFYFIALRANVPMVFGYADYQRKVVGFGPMMMPSGDLDADFEHIKRYARFPAAFPNAKARFVSNRPEISRQATCQVKIVR
ncbi:MAG: glycerol acyltransferase [Chloroflexi bacterium]|nr:MAG: glycerol acyltransferase [Chloroflexota bacterium]